jgi:hypothetical protein
VPLPISSRSAPSVTSTAVKPSPIASASTSARGRLFLEAKASARPMMAQLVTISGMKMPRIRYRSWNQAFIESSMAVTTEAMIST